MVESYQVRKTELSGDVHDIGHGLRLFARLLRRHRVFLIIFTFLGGVLVYCTATLMPPRYTARAVLLLGSQGQQALSIGDGGSRIRLELPDVATQSQMLYSQDLAQRVIDQLHLRDDEEFTRRPLGLRDRIAAISTDIAGALRWVGDVVKQPEVSVSLDKRSDDDPVLRRFFKQLSVNPVERSFAISIEFTASSAARAADVANAVANAFVEMQVENKRKGAYEASNLLEKWLGDLRAEMAKAEGAVEDYRVTAGLMQSRKDETASDQQLAELNSQLLAARVARVKSEAQLEILNRSAGDGIQALPDVLNSAVIQALRGQESRLVQQAAELSSAYGPAHPYILKVQSELDSVRGKIRDEIGRIAQSLRSEVAMAKSREQQLAAGVRQAEEHAGAQDNSAVRVHELQSEAEALRSVYSTVASRLVESRLQQQRATSDATVAVAAIAPDAPSFPKKLPAAVVGLVGFFVLGIAVVQVREKAARGFTSSDQLHRVSGLPVLALVPRVQRSQSARSQLAGTDQDPFFREALSGLHTALLTSQPTALLTSQRADRAPRADNVTLVTSSVPEEGKSLLVTSLATRVARSGCRTLLLDCDFRLPTTHLALNLSDEIGLLQYLLGHHGGEALIQTHESGLEFIASGTGGRGGAAEGNSLYEMLPILLTSPKLQGLLATMSLRYDLVIIDSPPVLGTSDALLLARHADRILYVVRWRDTPRDTVVSGLQKLTDVAPRGVAVTLTQVDPRRYAFGDSADAEIYKSRYRRYLERA
jgi:uncharacterized protein involved in exopolysaccharide biosynthesis/Mrp family chromosome partitioning ATPase